MLAQLPDHTISKPLHTYEHLDILWGKDVDKDVIPQVLQSLQFYRLDGEHESARNNVKPISLKVI
jgi:lysosomal acid lipase/cholesteryl ester hydrolase